MPPLHERLNFGESRRPEFGPIWLDLPSRTLRAAGTDTQEHLTPQEYQLLWLLVRAQGNFVTPSDIASFIHDEDRSSETQLGSGLDVRLAALRAKLETVSGNRVTIEYTYRFGYFLKQNLA